ncbi:MAG: hypothetical protein DRP37_08675 [Thermodesulfobacteriota bacterium]|nr:MAG: hypothetical protein DRP37_08675 [Thermodesulfobacteriota bacterium]
MALPCSLKIVYVYFLNFLQNFANPTKVINDYAEKSSFAVFGFRPQGTSRQVKSSLHFVDLVFWQ